MNVQQLAIGQRRFEKLALNGVRLALAAGCSALGCGLLFLPRIAEDLARGGYGFRFRILVGAFHLAGGIALLLPHFAARVARVLGLFVAGVAVYLLAKGEGVMTIEPALLALVLLLFGLWLRLRHQADVTVWRKCLLATPSRRQFKVVRLFQTLAIGTSNVTLHRN